jgi:ubiquinone/menaquinone biosynthesis C-methylase UbiE
MRYHHLMRARLRRTFWSVYGRYVWDRQRARQSGAVVRRTVQILEARASRAGERVLDAGCGTGDYAIALAEAGFRVVGIDYAPGMLARARSKLAALPETTASFQLASLDAVLPIPDASFDDVILIGVLQAVKKPLFTLDQVWRTLRPGGTIVIAHYPRPALHEMTFRDEVRARLARIGSRTPLTFALVAAKTWAERTGATRYWTADEIQRMLGTSGFRVLSTEILPPIIVVAEKAGA